MGDNIEFGINNEEIFSILRSESTEMIQRYDGLESIAKRLGTDLENGLDDKEDLTLRRLIYGINKYPEAPSASWLEIFFEAFGDIAVIILTISAVVALSAGIAEQALGLEQNGWIEGIAIIIAVLIVASVGATNDVIKDQQFQELRKKADDMKELIVIRGGHRVKIGIPDLCVGDILVLPWGIRIPADGIFLPTGEKSVECNMSSINGESKPRKITEKNPFLVSGTSIDKGECNMLVLAVGPRSAYGRLCASLIKDRDEDQTPLQIKLEDMVVLIGWIGLGFAIATFIVLMAYYIDEDVVHVHQNVDCISNSTIFWEDVQKLNTSADGTYVYGCPTDTSITSVSSLTPKFDPSTLTELLRAFIVGVTIIVVAVPEGLPLAVTVSLAYSVKIMLQDNNLVRRLEACETMGGVTNICSDKTGTLTQNKMTVTEGYIAGCIFEDPGDLHREGEKLRIGEKVLSSKVTRLLEGATVLNNEDSEPNATETALIEFTEHILKKKSTYEKAVKKGNRVKKWGFNSDKKRMSSVLKVTEGYRLYCKGASEMVLKLCKYKVQSNGEVQQIDKKERKNLQNVINSMAEKALRVVCLAYKDIAKKSNWDASEEGAEFETDMTFIGLIGIIDPLRPEVTEAVRKCKRAGITVRMVTGDYKTTAQAIATKCGILTDGIVMEGSEFERLKDDELKEILDRDSDKKLQVLARSYPADKQRLVSILMELGEVVAVTGDGTNDAPALKKAHVGLAMNSGTDVAQLAADIIIIDNNFASVVNAVKWGRCVFDNIRKFLQFQLTVNVVALVLAFIGAITRAGTPLTAVQLLWVNLIMDTLAALALGTEKPTDELLYRKPYGLKGKLLTPIMWKMIIGHSIYQLAWLCATLYAVGPVYHLWLPNVVSSWNPNSEGILSEPTPHYTVIFNIFVLMQLFNEINCRKINLERNVFEGILTNWLFVSIIVITIGIQALIIEFGDRAFMTTHLSWDLWLISIAIGAGELIWGFILRFVPVPLEEWEKQTPDIQ